VEKIVQDMHGNNVFRNNTPIGVKVFYSAQPALKHKPSVAKRSEVSL
jgi:hypothetical protein